MPAQATSTPTASSNSHRTIKTAKSPSDTTNSSPVIVATPASNLDPEPDELESVLDPQKMDASQEQAKSSATTLNAQQAEPSTPTPETSSDKGSAQSKSKKSAKQDKKGTGKQTGTKNTRKSKVLDSSEDESSDDESSSESSEDEREKRKRRKKAAKKRLEKQKVKAKAKKRKSKDVDSSNDDSDADESSASSDSESESEVDKKTLKKRAKAKAKAKAKTKAKKSKKADSSSDDSSSSSSSCSSDSDSESEPEKKRNKKKSKKSKAKKSKKVVVPSDSESSVSEEEQMPAPEATVEPTTTSNTEEIVALITARQTEIVQLQQLLGLPSKTPVVVPPPLPATTTEDKKNKKKGKLEFKRVDQVWDPKLRDFKCTDSTEEKTDEIDSIFRVRRVFNWKNKYMYTLIDVKSSLLQDALQVILKDVKGQSLVEETPEVDPQLIFLYYEELKAYYKKTLQKELAKEKKKKQKKRIIEKIAHCKLLAKYIDLDFSKTRKQLKSMLKAGTITFDLMWALFKPNTISYTTTYGNKEDPRAFKVDYCYRQEDFMGQEWWQVEGRYLEYDGKSFGLGDHVVRIEHFKGTRKITGLETFPLSFHKNEEELRQQLIERGKKFVALQGMNYRFHKGLAYQKRKRTVIKHNIDGRVMVDPAIFRRINPNYPLSYLKHKEDEGDDSEDEQEGCCCESDESEGEESAPKMKLMVYKDENGETHFVEVPVGEEGPDLSSEKLECVGAEAGTRHMFSEEELLIASSVVLGFAFSEKNWLEFSLSGIKEIQWNSEAFDSLVLRPDIKQNLKGLVSSHRFNAAKTIDDVIQGKGKGLNVVLHGPPGVGKTLTGESIADFLRCPLYAVSAGELGTNSRTLEGDLQRIMDITHSWGAILLLDEADVFLEQRQAQDVHRNALVSVFLRLTEYYQGIMFMTTNRVSTFDEAFQSRIHMGIRYENLGAKARKEIWMHHVKKIEKLEDQESKPFKCEDFIELSKRVMNGRQIKNAVITAQSIALSEKDPFSMAHIKRLLDVQEEFDNDMRGGTGYREAMRQYT